MWKIKGKNLINFLKFVFFLFVIWFWVSVIAYIIFHVLMRDDPDANDLSAALSIWVLLIITSSFLINCYMLPKCEDWLYKWKDWRVYQWDWSKFFWANWKWKLTWADWSYYEWEFKNGKLYWKWKKVLPNWERYEWDWKDDKANWKWKSIWVDGSYYEWEFKNGKPHWMWIIEMKNWYYYEWEFSDWKRTWKFKKQILTSWWIIEWEFRDNWNNGFDWNWKVTTSNWFTFEWIFKNWSLSWEWKATFPDGSICVWDYVNWELNWLARCYFKDGSYYEWECKQWNWYWVWTYVTKKWDKYSTEFPYEIINVFMYWLKSKMKEIQWKLNYIPMDEKEKQEEKNKNLEIFEKWTLVQKEIVKLSLNEQEKLEILLDSLKVDNSLWNNLEVHKNMLKFYEEHRKKNREIANKNHIKSSKSASSNSYWKYFYELDCIYGIIIEIFEFYIKFDKFLDSKNILDFVTKREEKNRERVILIDEFSEKYKEYIQSCLDWREYEKKFWNHNFKQNKDKK